jgi:elongation factor 1 alpha-like protein
MSKGLKRVREVLDASSGITDDEIRDALWYYYFNVEKTVNWLVGKRTHA